MTVKSQDDLHKPETHSTEVLLSTIEKLEKTKKQLEIAKRGLNFIVAQSYGKDMWDCAKGTLKQIEELEK